jgi:hypothetical protein
MGLFNKHNTSAPRDTTESTGVNNTREKRSGIFGKGPSGAPKGSSPNSYNTRPSFGSWIKATALDIVTMAAMGAIGLGVYFARPAPNRSFPSKYHLLSH